jgi:hypothetical protein
MGWWQRQTRCASPGTAINGVTARFGVSIVSTEAEEEVARHAVLDRTRGQLRQL